MNNQDYSGYSKRWLLLGIVIAILIGTYSYTFDSKLALLGDNASYYMLGKSISQGEGYVNISKVTKSPNNHYPPGYPAFISVMMLFTDSIVAVKLLNGLFLFGALILAYLLISRLTENYFIAFIVTVLCAFNSHLLFYGSLMMSEVPYMFFSLLGIYLFTLIDFDNLKSNLKYLIGMLFSMVIAYYVRSLGVALLAGFCLHFLVNQNWKMMGITIGSMIIGGLPWFIRGQAHGGASYMNQLKMINPYNPGLGEASLGDFADRFWSNFSRYITKEIPDVIFNYGPDYGQPAVATQWILGLLLLILIFIGIFQLSKYKWMLLGYLLGTFGILMIWPDVWIGVRFIVPIIPILILGFLNGFYFLFRKIRNQENISSAVLYAPFVIVLFLIKPLGELHDKAKADFPPAWKRYFEIAEWIKTNEKEVVVSCGKPSLFYTYAGNFTMRYKFTKDASELIADLEKQRVDYVVIDQVYGNTFQYLLPAIRQYPNRFEQVIHLKNPDTFLLKFK